MHSNKVLSVLFGHLKCKSSVTVQPTHEKEVTNSGTKKNDVFTVKRINLDFLDEEIEMVYGDTCNRGCPIAFGIHGGVSTHRAFNRLAEVLVGEGYRVVVPNMPGMALTPLARNSKFFHTVEDKVMLMKEILRKLRIERIGLLFGHSMGGHLVAHVAAEPDMLNRVDSICIFASIGPRPHKSVRLYHTLQSVIQFFYKAAREPHLHGEAVSVLRSMVPKGTFLYKGQMMEDDFFLNLAMSLASYDFAQFREDLAVLQKLPTLFICCDKDPVIEVEIQEESISILGMDQQKRWLQNGQILGEPFGDDELRRALIIKDGDHFPHYSEIQVLNPHIIQFLQLVRDSRKSQSLAEDLQTTII